jgi:hypothetical protein
VGTARDLSASPLFSIAVWEEGAVDTDSATDVFVIKGKAEAAESSSSLSTTNSSASTTFMTSKYTPFTTSTNTDPDPAATSTPLSTDQPATTTGGLPTSAAVGTGIGVALAVVLLVGAGWYFGRFGLGKQADKETDTDLTGPVEYVRPDRYYYPEPGGRDETETETGSGTVEVSAERHRPVELSVDGRGQ